MSYNYLKEDEKHRNEILKQSGVKEEDLKRDVKIVQEWMKTQKHLPQEDIQNDMFVERLLLNNKFRIEQTKTKIDNFYTTRRVHKILYEDLCELVPSKINLTKIPLKTLTEDKKRIIMITTLPGVDVAKYLDNLRLQILVSEIIMKDGYCNTQIGVFDMAGFKSNIFKDFDMILLYKVISTLQSCYSGRVSEVHVINASILSKIFLAFLQKIFGSKVKVHNDLESLYKSVPKKYLPKDYGGDDLSLTEYSEIWDKIVKEEIEYIKSIPNKVPDESLRIGKCKLDEETYGVDGTFKKLNID